MVASRITAAMLSNDVVKSCCSSGACLHDQVRSNSNSKTCNNKNRRRRHHPCISHQILGLNVHILFFRSKNTYLLYNWKLRCFPSWPGAAFWPSLYHQLSLRVPPWPAEAAGPRRTTNCPYHRGPQRRAPLGVPPIVPFKPASVEFPTLPP